MKDYKSSRINNACKYGFFIENKMDNETQFIDAKNRVESKLYFTAHDFSKYKRDDFAVNFRGEFRRKIVPCPGAGHRGQWIDFIG